jgi:hypothetical protein
MRIAALVLLLIASLGGFWTATAAHADDPPVVTLRRCRQAAPPKVKQAWSFRPAS